MISREEWFRKWLIDLTPGKVDLLVKLENGCRMTKISYDLSGELDMKQWKKMADASEALKDSYMKLKDADENQPK